LHNAVTLIIVRVHKLIGVRVDQDTKLRRLADRRFRIATILTAAMIVLYFGFVSLVAFGREFLARLIVPGLSVGILLGALVIVVSWILTWIYVRWANTHYDPAQADYRRGEK
jgi:uncharacterized membrane protein (DUF485 family)